MCFYSTFYSFLALNFINQHYKCIFNGSFFKLTGRQVAVGFALIVYKHVFIILFLLKSMYYKAVTQKTTSVSKNRFLCY